MGAAGTVTGSCYALTSQAGDSILIDCGMFQGSPELDELNFQPFQFAIENLQGAVLTHAHLDHCGRLPLLLKHGFHQPIYMTAPTLDIASISLADSAKIHASAQEEDKVLYEQKEVDAILERAKVVAYHQTFSLGSFTITMRDAGHILGSASLEIIDTSATSQLRKIIFSGDLGNTPQSLIQPTEYFPSADTVVMESTYGDRTHALEDAQTMLEKEVRLIEQSGGVLLIPAFSIERSQELLHAFHHLKLDKKISAVMPVFFDGPMATKVNEVFHQYPNLLNDEFRPEILAESGLTFPGLQVVRKPDESHQIQEVTGPKVIIAGSGMMTGGRILQHAANYLPQPSTRLLFVGYQGENTLGRQILDGQKHVTINNRSITINATISKMSALSSHADQPRLLTWLSKIQGVQKVFLTHGEDGPRTQLAGRIQQKLQIANIALPQLNQLLTTG